MPVSEPENGRWPFLEFDVVEGADDRGVDDPEVGLAQLLIERRVGLARCGLFGERTPVEVSDIEPAVPRGGGGVGRGFRDFLEGRGPLILGVLRHRVARALPACVSPSAKSSPGKGWLSRFAGIRLRRQPVERSGEACPFLAREGRA